MMAKTSVSFKLTFLVRGGGRGGGGGGELFIVKGPVMPGGWEMSIWILLFCVKHLFSNAFTRNKFESILGSSELHPIEYNMFFQAPSFREILPF